jgi:hypothetical protein
LESLPIVMGSRLYKSFLPLGAYPAVGLADARRVSLAARELLAKGVDPVAQKKTERANQARADISMFQVIAEELVAKKIREGKSERACVFARRILGGASRNGAMVGRLLG